MKRAPHPHDRRGTRLPWLCLLLLCHLIGPRAAAQEPALRTTDELTVLYTTAVLYGLGSSAWLALQVEPGNIAGALVPFAVLAPAGAALVAWADNTRPLRHGVPHALAAGMYLGLGEGLWLNAFQSAYAGRHPGVERWGPQRASTSLWLTSTAGGLFGALVGATQGGQIQLREIILDRLKYIRRDPKARNAMVEHIRARAGTWDGDISGEELLRRTRP